MRGQLEDIEDAAQSLLENLEVSSVTVWRGGDGGGVADERPLVI